MTNYFSEKLRCILADERLRHNLNQELQLIVAAIVGVGLLLLASLSGNKRGDKQPLSPPLSGKSANWGASLNPLETTLPIFNLHSERKDR